MTAEERRYQIFKIFYHNSADEEILNEIEKLIRRQKFINNDSYNIMKEAKMANRIHCEIKENRTNYSDVMYNYNIILENMLNLSKELNLDNSLELCILFSYLLWYGYLSKNREYKFNPNNKKIIPGLFFSSIMDGRGVCLHNSEMLKDFLNLCDYNCVMLENHSKMAIKAGYNIAIKRTCVDTEKTKFIKLFDAIYKYGKPNHAFNLIEENNNFYIYDSTNLLLLSVINMYKSKVINGEEIVKLFPYKSYMLCVERNEIEILDEFIDNQVYSFPYQNYDLAVTSDITLELLKYHKNLLDDFYTEIKPNIMEISKETDKIVRQRKK